MYPWNTLQMCFESIVLPSEFKCHIAQPALGFHLIFHPEQHGLGIRNCGMYKNLSLYLQVIPPLFSRFCLLFIVCYMSWFDFVWTWTTNT